MIKKIYLVVLELLVVLAALAAFSAHAADIPLGAGDVVKITVFGNRDLNLETKVSETGSITFPLIGEVGVAGLSTSNTEKKIAGLLVSGGFLRTAQVNIMVTELQSQKVSMLGHVLHQGMYPIDGPRTVTDMLALAGGVGPNGGDTATIIFTRNGVVNKQIVDLVDMVHSADMRPNMPLISGDMVYVEQAPKFYIYGEVQHPGGYRLERHMSVMQALSVGGGLTPRGTENGLRVKRQNTAGKVHTFGVKNDDELLPDDVVYVKESLF
ncbi:polysaccharide export protein EpsE [Glaciimonas sp. CA11.2]|uniref:polysaccharide export protein EpsE n=1 Tax=unclassified Glaciimonas TaxID=2644401 RepID=UPI002AB43CAB|nr:MULTISPECIES: polysaccharide export protein EpsE [unclassified Glaciimonas]MDY7546236.1 polysaccharide export protein EpsE [Glaciimonas sp. CA11.2]MEB0010814.1 polysaccharide export protein EpsE [Glaciimonas sp. Cout2]MEB0082050.1 polysaccharide export protein EpsE [Glaciimonas sp. Gout2]MEB0163781.1 polysaccharide export protein EpsE [Glaciimonas sp. CA11.2]